MPIRLEFGCNRLQTAALLREDEETLMADGGMRSRSLGWVGTGRMGYRLVTRLLEAGCDVAVYNRTRAKAEPLAGIRRC